MVYLIFDTNIWIYFAGGQHPFVLNGIIKKVENNEVTILVNEEIIKEWNRNKAKCKDRIKKELDLQIRSAKNLYSTLEEKDSLAYQELVSKISNQTHEYKNTIDERFNIVNDLITNKSIPIPIKEEHKLSVMDLALNQKAPFHRKKNSVADALILLSAIDYIKNNGINNVNYNRIDVSDSIFVSYNSDDFSKDVKGSDKDIIHPDLQPYLDSVGMTYERNFGKILSLTEEMTDTLDAYMDYVEDRIEQQMLWENEIRRGK